MKKLVLIISVFLSVSMMAQDKAKLQSQVAKSDAEINDPKKAEQPKVWLNRAELFLDVYDAPAKNLMTGMGNRDIKLLLAKEKIVTNKSVDLLGETYDVDVYADKELYYDAAGQLVLWIVTDFAADTPLLKALEAYMRAVALDAKGSNTKKIKDGLLSLQPKLSYDGYIAYIMQNYPTAAINYQAAIECSNHPLIATPDTTAYYMVGLIALNSGNPEKAVSFYKQAMDAGYTAGGDIYAEYARALKAKQDTTAAIEMLTTGLAAFPTNKEIIFTLINTFIEKGEDPKNILPYVLAAEESDPNNASVNYVEGIVYEQLKDFSNAEKAYQRAIEKDENYFFAYYNLGVLYYNEGADINNKAIDVIEQEKYEAMMAQAHQIFKNAIEPLEKACELNPSERSTVDLLKILYFRFREDDEEMAKKYEHYRDLMDSM
ncbi:MAG: tetratricopeptide repeat protein [Prevotellaceae bacterium]|jgi:tetratricopeptide (TPR) repeat protein|nr:tetratricopeptide repeat protein [Prevotellaceae bacterium]